MSFSSYGALLTPVSGDQSYKERPEFQAVYQSITSLGKFKDKSPEVKVTPKKTMSAGERAVEEAKARNRERLKEMYKEDQKKFGNVDEVSELDKWKLEEKKTLEAWKKDTQDKLNLWKKEEAIFLGKLKEYKENTFVMPVKTEKIVEKEIPKEIVPEIFVVNKSFDVPVRDQGQRPTCVAFAGIRAVEILLKQNGKDQDLSEQYLYWAGKPRCQKSPCNAKGSWIKEAFGYSKKQKKSDIPLENKCQYVGMSVDNNETQLPMNESCFQGEVKVREYKEARTIRDLLEELKLNRPVVIASRLSENFYKNNGLITLMESGSTGEKLNQHSLGHAYLAIGVIELPEKLHESEGDFCILVTNSWGKGWGRGGYSCVTEKWLETFRQKSPFISLVSLETSP